MSNFKSVLGALVLGTFTVTSPVMAASWSGASCRSIIAEKYWGTALDSAADYIAGLPLAEKFGSTCNMHSFIEAECRLHPNGTVGAAVKRLLLKAPSNKELPDIPSCGA